MIVRVPRREPRTEENVLPLINIVFLLLIFFMIAGAISTSAPFPLDPPATEAADTTAAPRNGVAIAADGRLAMGGDSVALDELSERVRAWQKEASADDVLSVRADEAAPNRRLFEVLERLRAADVETIRLLSTGAQEGG